MTIRHQKALKGRHNVAQGNALGMRNIGFQALKGRSKMKRTIIVLLLCCASTVTALAQPAEKTESSLSLNAPAIPASPPVASTNLVSLLGSDRPKDAVTEITATDEATFDNATNIATFKGNVVVRDPQFDLQCDTLTVTLAPNRRGLTRVEAEGNVIIVRETKNEDGKPARSEGRAKKVIYEAETGQATLTGWPQIRHGLHTQVATEEGTVMVLNRDGKSTTTGSSRTVVGDTSPK